MIRLFFVLSIFALYSTTSLYAQWGSRGSSGSSGSSSSRASRSSRTGGGSDDTPAKKTYSKPIDEHQVLVEFEGIIEDWEITAKSLGTYRGLSKYCEDQIYKDSIDGLLGAIHHYDSLLYSVLKEKSLYNSSHELSVTIKEIDALETKFKPANFHKHLKDDCRGKREIEKNEKKIRNDLNIDSYDGQSLILDTDIHQYIHRITHLVELIDKHALHLID